MWSTPHAAVASGPSAPEAAQPGQCSSLPSGERREQPNMFSVYLCIIGNDWTG